MQPSQNEQEAVAARVSAAEVDATGRRRQSAIDSALPSVRIACGSCSVIVIALALPKGEQLLGLSRTGEGDVGRLDELLIRLRTDRGDAW